MRILLKPYFCPKCGIMIDRIKTSVHNEFKGHYNVIHRRCKKCGEHVISTEKIINNMMYKDVKSN